MLENIIKITKGGFDNTDINSIRNKTEWVQKLDTSINIIDDIQIYESSNGVRYSIMPYSKSKTDDLCDYIVYKGIEAPVIGNEWFRTKVSTKLSAKTGYIDSNYPIASALVKEYDNISKPYWNKEDIIINTEKASRRIASFIFDN